MTVFFNGSPLTLGLSYRFLSVTAHDSNIQLSYTLKNKPCTHLDRDEYHHKLDRILDLLERPPQQEQIDADNGLLRDAEYVKSYVGISTETLFRLQRDGHITVARRERNKRYYRDVDVERLRNSYRGL